jgi:hypothetical protein
LIEERRTGVSLERTYYKSVACAEKAHEMCSGHYSYSGKPLPPLLRNADPWIHKHEGQFAAISDERSPTVTAATKRNHDLHMMCRCPCHLKKLYEEQERLSALQGALEVGMPSDID